MTVPVVTLNWKQRAVERSIKVARLRAEQRAQQILDAARAILVEKGSTDFTVQEIIDRSGQSLRSFYGQFGGKQELLQALFEESPSWSASHIRVVAADHPNPLDRLKLAVQVIFELCRRNSPVKPPLFTGCVPASLTADPAYPPLLALLTEFMEAASLEGSLRADGDPARMATLALHAIVFIAKSSIDCGGAVSRPISAHDVWDFCAHGLAPAN
jgi:AcrR family transcriptional regulator